MDSLPLMENAGHALLPAYKQALETLRKFDADIQHQLERLLGVGRGDEVPTARDLAFLEGLRVERDKVYDVVRTTEHQLFEELLARLGCGPSRT